AAARGGGARAGRRSAHPVGRRADRKPRFGERRAGDGAAARAAPRRHHDLHGDPRPALRPLRAALHPLVRRAGGGRPGGRVMDSWWQDLKVGWRSLWRTPAFACVVILIMGLGIGANTMIF